MVKISSGKRGWRWAGGLVAGFLLCWLGGWTLLCWTPLPAGLNRPPPPGIELLDRHGRTLREIADDRSAFARRVPYAEIPQALVAATLAAEDQRFWRHGGVDWRATVRAAWGWVRYGRFVSGGSTITQQLIKLAEPRPRTFRTKIIEAIQARRLEQVWSKEHILEDYFNRLDYGNLRRGCASAAHYYFGQPLSDLSVAQAALLAGLPQAPGRLNPQTHLDRAKKRQEWILGRLRAAGFLAEAEYRRALLEPLRLRSAGRPFRAPHFVDLLIRQEAEMLRQGPEHPVQTTLDLDLNRVAETILRDQLNRLKAQHVGNGAVVVLDNRSGEVLALVGSEDFFSPKAGQVNGAWAPRSAGSTFKPFTYLLALEQGATPSTVVADVPTEFATPTGLFAPANYNHRCYGPMRYRLALANSLNISAVKVLAAAGGPAALQERLRNCGLTTLNQPAEFYGLGLTIGNAEARLLELANAYACLARLGEYMPYRLVTAYPDAAAHPPQYRPRPRPSSSSSIRQTGNSRTRTRTRDEDERERGGRQSRQVCDPGAAYLIADILSDNRARTLAFGVASSLRFDFPVACKTGTSTDFRDNWALGFTPEFTVGVWVGNFDGTPMEQVSGVTGAAPILHEVFVYLHERYGTGWYEPPGNVVEKLIHPVTGKRLRPSTPDAVREKFLVHCQPEMERDEDYDVQGRVRLGEEYRGWLASGDNWLANRVSAEVAATSSSQANKTVAALVSPRILTPLPGTVYYLDPDLPASSRWIELKVQGAARVVWQSSTLECRSERGRLFVILAEGRHDLMVRDLATGTEAGTWIQVKSL